MSNGYRLRMFIGFALWEMWAWLCDRPIREFRKVGRHGNTIDNNYQPVSRSLYESKTKWAGFGKRNRFENISAILPLSELCVPIIWFLVTRSSCCLGLVGLGCEQLQYSLLTWTLVLFPTQIGRGKPGLSSPKPVGTWWISITGHS